jgi:deoxycytidylate deaminase
MVFSLLRPAYAEYGITQYKTGDYEVDHLIPLSLGGSNSIRNLWPQATKTTPWNSYVKDALERKLHKLVCAGQLDLKTAQSEIAAIQNEFTQTTILMTTDEYYMGIAIAVREKANCLGRKVGAVLVKENRIISTGYNGTPEGVDNCLEGGCVRRLKKEQFAPSVGMMYAFASMPKRMRSSRQRDLESRWKEL